LAQKKNKQSKQKKRKEAQRKAKAQHKSQPKIFRDNPGLKESLDFKHPLVDCLINEDWEEKKVATISIIRDAPVGRLVVSFQIDLETRGFIRGWGNFGLSIDEVKEMRKEYEKNKGKLIDCDLSLVKSIVYGGMDWAREWGYKIPKDSDMWLKALEPLEAGENNDNSLFG